MSTTKKEDPSEAPVQGASPVADTAPSVDQFALHFLGPEQLLPPRCPLCAAPGVVPHSFALPKSKAGGGHSTVEAYYCDLCAEARNRDQTREIASRAAWIVLTAALATALSLAFGTRQLLLQILPLLLLPCFPYILRKTRLWKLPRQGIWLIPGNSEEQGAGLGVLSSREKFSSVLSLHGLSPSSIAPGEAKNVARGRPAAFSLWLAGGGLLWLFLIHFLGVAQVRVLVGGADSASLLVDSRKVATIQAANSEDPRAGRVINVMGGRRHLELVTERGRQVADGRTTIWPGRTYIVGDLPEGKCLFWEEQSYGEQGMSHSLSVLPGTGPIWELSGRVDSWFMPLTLDGEDEQTELPLSGGVRRGVRLLPCEPTAGRNHERGPLFPGGAADKRRQL